jgi:hypothetical protein
LKAPCTLARCTDTQARCRRPHAPAACPPQSRAEATRLRAALSEAAAAGQREYVDLEQQLAESERARAAAAARLAALERQQQQGLEAGGAPHPEAAEQQQQQQEQVVLLQQQLQQMTLARDQLQEQLSHQQQHQQQDGRDTRAEGAVQQDGALQAAQQKLAEVRACVAVDRCLRASLRHLLWAPASLFAASQHAPCLPTHAHHTTPGAGRRRRVSRAVCQAGG